MEDRLKNVVLEALSEEPEIKLYVGENDYYMEYMYYSITINYSLDINESYFSDDNILVQSGYKFRINSIYVTNNDTDTDVSIEPDKEIEYTMFTDAYIEDWSDELNDDKIDEYFTENF